MKKATVELEYQPYIDQPPRSPNQLFAQACSNDEPTINAWRPTWIKNVRENHEKFGPFAEKSLGKLFGTYHQRPVIVAGAGPSLKGNIADLKARGDIPLVSCLHNFHFLEDNGAGADFYVTLDAGDITVDEVSEGGSKSPDEYWAMTKNRKLIAYIGTSPRLLDKWQGEIYFFNAPIPAPDITKIFDEIETFNVYVSNGGNVLGACLYIAKAFLGASVTAFVGADFSFSYDKKFHGWDSKYDANLGHAVRLRDVYGIPVWSWQSYVNFKGWFEYISMTVPGFYINCSEGGTLGSYDQGNLRSIIQMPLAAFVRQMNMYKDEIAAQAANPKITEKKILF